MPERKMRVRVVSQRPVRKADTPTQVTRPDAENAGDWISEDVFTTGWTSSMISGILRLRSKDGYGNGRNSGTVKISD